MILSASANGISDTRTISFVVDADISPKATKVGIRGFHETGATLTGSYIYSDENNDAESGSELLWYRVNGSTKKLIGTGLTYTLKPADENANIICGNSEKRIFNGIFSYNCGKERSLKKLQG